MIRAIVVSRDLGHHGGVVGVVRMLMEHMPAQVRCIHFSMGGKPGEGMTLRRLVSPVIDAVRLFRLAVSSEADVAQVNPSLRLRPVLRDGLFCLALRAAGVPRVVFFHGWDESLAGTIRFSWLRAPFRWFFGGGKVVALSGRIADTLRGMGFADHAVEVFSTMFDGREFQAVEQVEKSGRTILFMGRMVREKGVYDLLEAYDRLGASDTGWRLVMAGDGPVLRDLQRLAADKGLDVIFPGFVSGTEKFEMIKSADIFTLPSHGEGCPVSLIEAMAGGCACVVSDVGGVPDVAANGRDALLVGAGDVSGLAGALQSLMKDSSLRKRLGANAAERAWGNYEAGAVALRMAGVYAEAAGRKQ